jgi:hypothetical protein
MAAAENDDDNNDEDQDEAQDQEEDTSEEQWWGAWQALMAQQGWQGHADRDDEEYRATTKQRRWDEMTRVRTRTRPDKQAPMSTNEH